MQSCRLHFIRPENGWERQGYEQDCAKACGGNCWGIVVFSLYLALSYVAVPSYSMPMLWNDQSVFGIVPIGFSGIFFLASAFDSGGNFDFVCGTPPCVTKVSESENRTNNWNCIFSNTYVSIRISYVTGGFTIMKRSALFFDIDGTLLSEVTKEIPRSAVRALKEAQDRGHLVFINTGRTYASIPPEFIRLQLDGYMCGCGTYLVYENQLLFEYHIPKERGIEIVQKMHECNFEGVLEGTEDVYFPTRISRFEQLESTRRHFASRGLGTEKSIESKDYVYDKLFMYGDEKSDMDKFAEFTKEDLEIIDRGNQTYECIPKAYSKGTAIEYMCQYLNIDLNHVFVFGDSSNDLSMFQAAKHTIALENHDPVLEPYTEYVTGTVEADGIYRAMLHYGLIEG